MRSEASVKRAVSFVDGQNLYYAAKKAFGYTFPNYDAIRLSERVCADNGWTLVQVRFYTGVPSAVDRPKWNHFWNAKLGSMGHAGAYVFQRQLKYRNVVVNVPGGGQISQLVGEEKGIDVRLALDIVRLATQQQYDVALIFSQDQDLSEAADEVRNVAREQNRWIKLVSLFPFGATGGANRRGINGTDWITIDKALYDSCIDPRDYRPAP